MIIQPTTYSDKTKFVNYMVSTIFGGKDITQMSNTELEEMYVNSIGKGYKTILSNVLRDYAQIFDMQDLYAQAYQFDDAGFVISTNEAIVR
jgi:hypothetical protein